ncbi:PTS sugar transporter subunit IIA [Lacticaseibacillus suibinensis]|nr:PTS mannose transporter subunit IIA [Lacticaseibacillus suibinensis]
MEMVNVVKIILVSHNQLAAGMKHAVEMIAGTQPQLSAYGLMPGQKPDDVVAQIAKTLPAEEPVLILADLVGGSMCNACMALLVHANVQLIGGMNLALVLQLVLAQQFDQDSLQHIMQQAQQGIQEVKLQKVTEDDPFF